MPRRIEQVNSFIQEELNNIFLAELEIRDALITITKVSTDKDLNRAKIFLSILPITQKGKILHDLSKKSGYLRHLLSGKFQGFHVPKLEFIFDDSLMKQRLVERELENIHKPGEN